MKLEQSFEVEAPLERVWQTLIDVEHVAPCLPGAAVTGRNDDGSYNGTFTVKIGPTTASYAGKLAGYGAPPFASPAEEATEGCSVVRGLPTRMRVTSSASHRQLRGRPRRALRRPAPAARREPAP